MTELVTYLVSGIALGSSFALIGSGFVVVHRVTRVVNFAQGSLAVVGGMVSATLLGGLLPHGLGEVAAVLICGGVGLLVGLLALGRRGTPPLISLIVTLGVSMLISAAIIWLWGQDPVSPPGLDGSVTILGATVERQRLLVLGRHRCVAFAALALFFSRSYVGKALTASASNPFAARMVGIDVRRMGLLAFGLAGVLGGLAGVLVAPTNARVVLLRPAAGAQRLRGRRLRWARPARCAPGRRPGPRRRRPADRGLPQRLLPDRGGPAADAGHHDRPEQHVRARGGQVMERRVDPKTVPDRRSPAWPRCLAPAGDGRPHVPDAHGARRHRRDRAVAADGVRRPGLARPGRVRGRRRADRGARHHAAAGCHRCSRCSPPRSWPGRSRPLVGVPLLRLQGHYLAFGTLALLLMVQAAMSTFDVPRRRLRHQRHPAVRRRDRHLHRPAAVRLPRARLPGRGPGAHPPGRAQPLRPRASARSPAARPRRSPRASRSCAARSPSSRCRRCTPASPARSPRSSRPT